MNVRDWLAHREPSPPHVLRERVDTLVAAVPDAPDDPAATLLAAAETALIRLGGSAPGDRSTALDLLAVDAVVTYALEYAAQAPEGIPQFSARVMARLSHVTASVPGR